MAKKKKKTWFAILKELFISKAVQKPDKEKRGIWGFGRLRRKRFPSIESSSSASAAAAREESQRRLSEAEEEQSKHAVTVAIAADAAAEAAVTAARVAADVVWLTGTRESAHQLIQRNSNPDYGFNDAEISFSQSTDHPCGRVASNLAAIRIQTAFRGYLARKALRALKGLVRLQAIIRGRAVRRQAVTTLKCLQSIVSIQSQVCARRSLMADGTNGLCHGHNEDFHDPRDKEIIKIDSNTERRWDDSLLSKAEANAVFFSKREAFIKRERIKEYSLTQRRSTESEGNKANGRLRYWLEQWVDTQLAKRDDDIQKPESVFPSNARISEGFRGRQMKLRNAPKRDHPESLSLSLDSPLSASRRSFHHQKQWSIGEDNGVTGSGSGSGSPVVPTYMAATESAKAKARSLSSPRLRPINILDALSETGSPYKHKLSPISSINSELTSISRVGSFQQRSPCLKGVVGPVKSKRLLKDLSFDSECSSQNWDQHGGLAV